MSLALKTNPRTFRLLLPNGAATTQLGAAQVGSTANTIILAAATASPTDNFYNQMFVTITGGTGAGQTRKIILYGGATKAATVDRPWDVIPVLADTYFITTAIKADPYEGVAVGGTANTISLSLSESLIDDWYNNLFITLIGGTGGFPGSPSEGRVRQIVDYVGAGRVATVNKPWGTNPAAGTLYRMPGHLYHPCAGLHIESTAATNYGIGLGTIGTGAYDRRTAGEAFEIMDAFAGVQFIEVIGDAAVSTINVLRAEG